jgi:CelD/BcsL family acetyltransferase involved in cellulose biosynthesis
MTGPEHSTDFGAAVDLREEIVTTEAGLDALRTEWNEACRSALPPNVFLTWEWTTQWWVHFGRSATLHILLWRDDQGIAAIAPLQIRSVGVGPSRSRVLERINPEAGDYGGAIVVRRPDDVAAALAEHVADLFSRFRISAFMFSRLASDDPLLESWRAATGRLSGRMQTREHRLEGICYFTDVRNEFSLPKLAKSHKINQRLRRIEEAHQQVEFCYHTGTDLERGLELLLEVHGQRWAERMEELQGLLSEPEREAFMLDAIKALDTQGWVRLLTLSADGRAVAAELDFEFGDRVFMFKGAFDPDFGAYSPGQLLHHRVFTDGMARGITIFDFGRGDQGYKQRWANAERSLFTTTTVASGWRGRLGSNRLRLNRALARRLASRSAASAS